MLLTCITCRLSTHPKPFSLKELLTLWIILCHTVRDAPEKARRGGRKSNEMATDRSRFAGKSPTPIVQSMAGRPKRAAGGRGLYHGVAPRYSDTLAIFLLKARRREKDHDRVTAERAGQRGPSSMNRIERARRIAFALQLGGQEIAKGAAPKDNASPPRSNDAP